MHAPRGFALGSHGRCSLGMLCMKAELAEREIRSASCHQWKIVDFILDLIIYIDNYLRFWG